MDGSVLLADVVIVPNTIGPGCVVGVGFSAGYLRPYTVTQFTQSPSKTVLHLAGVTSREGALALVDQAVYADASSVIANNDERYTIGEIIGCSVRAMNEDAPVADSNHHYVELGVVTDVLLLPANDVWVVTTDNGREVLLPVIDDVIKSVDVTSKVITINLIPGLLEPEDED